MWLRVGLTLMAVEGYNEQLYSEEDRKGFLDLANRPLDGSPENQDMYEDFLTKAYELLDY